MLTIGQLASYAGVTARTVRHYHDTGLLPEPERDASGYRRYDATAVVDLVRIRVLADAGVPLAKVRELLDAGAEEFAAAMTEVDARLQAEIVERERHRERIARLAAGESLALPPEGVAYLDRLRELGISEPVVAVERDSWILALAVYTPDQIAAALTAKRELLDDAEFVAVNRALGDAVDWEPDDPRLPGLADQLAAFLDGHADWLGDPTTDLGAVFVELLDSIALDSIPGGRRLEALLEERGWSGWTRLERRERRR